MWRAKLLAVAVVSIAVVTLFETTKGQWALATDVQKYYRCLPFDWYLVTQLNKPFEIQRGDLVQFEAPPHVERFTEAYEVIKIVVGVAGDRWAIENDEVFVNGRSWGDLHLLSSIDARTGSLDGEGMVPAGHVYVLGTNPSSYDSRYWGPLETRYIKGKAHVVF